MLVSSIQARVQVMAEEPTDLPKMLIRLNRLLISSSPGNRFVSLFFCRLDPATGRTEYVSAGHNPPFLVRAGGEVEQLTEGGPILGILPCAEYFLHTCRLDHGDVLVLYSDGVTEATGTGGEEFGEDRLAATLVQHRGKPASEVVEVVRSALADWTGGGQAEDDVTLVVAHRC
jgi:phosphoserine phosphatase RsbU/P